MKHGSTINIKIVEWMNKNNIFLLLTAEAHSLPAKSSVSLHPQLKIFPFSPFP